jgi:hypothetical protein
MGKAATRAKTKWNSANYKQVKVSIDPKVADAFKTACGTAGVSMAGELARFMAEYCGFSKNQRQAPSPDVSTRSKRRKAVAEAIGLMEIVRDAESSSHENVPENLRGAAAYDAAEESISMMDEAIELLGGIYW